MQRFIDKDASMGIDISKLSAKELYELARQKEQEEQRQAELNEHLNKLKQQRSELLAKFNKSLGNIEEEIKQLQQQREQLLSEHESALDRLDQQIRETGMHAKQHAHEDTPEPPNTATPVQSTPPIKPAAAPAPRPVARPSAGTQPPENVENIDDMYIKIRELTKTREYISETLLKEKLKGMGFSNTLISKGLDQLVKDKRLLHKGGGSYVLGKK
jgi:myosin heavy subunit